MTNTMRSMETLEIIGGALCLNFANTINSRRAPEYDYLSTYSDLAIWAVRTGELPAAQSHRLRTLAEQDAASAEGVFQKAVRFRELLYRLFSNIAQQVEPNRYDLAVFVARYTEAVSHSILVKKADHFAMDWKRDESLDVILWPIIYSAGEVLFSEQLKQVKECPDCGWLFLDTSKNQSRRWCSMDTCGARDKMRRYHRKLRQKQDDFTTPGS